MRRDVGANLVLDVTERAEFVFAVAVADVYATAREHLTARLDDEPLTVDAVLDLHGTRLHRVIAPPGRLLVDYQATIDDRTPGYTATESERIAYLRPSRYAESDTLAAVAAAEFSDLEAAADLLAAVSSWVGTRLSYIGGSSRPTDGAVRTLLSRKGVCRDYAHLCIALLRARGVPARMVAVYAPGLDPMDFHAVVEALVDGRWCAVDPTLLAPRESLVRIATGRDAADTAFLNVLSGRADLVDISVSAVVDELPTDDVTRLIAIG